MAVMDYYLIQYVAALYPLFIMVIILIIIRHSPGCRKCCWIIVCKIRRPFVNDENENMEKHVINAIVACMLFTYVNFVNISFQILAYAVFEDKNGPHPPVAVPFRQGTMEYFSIEHLPYALPALVICVICPVLLIIYSVMQCYNQNGNQTGNHNGNQDGILNQIYSQFTKKYKNSCHIFAGSYFIYIFLAFLIFSFASDIFQVYLLMSLLFLMAVLLHLRMKSKSTILQI